MFKLFAVLLALAWLGSALKCRQDIGRPCTELERTHAYINPNLQGDVHFPDSGAVLKAAHFAQSGFYWYSCTHPAAISHDGSLYVLFKMVSWCKNCEALCPDNSLYAVKKCSLVPNESYALNFVGYAKINSVFSIDGEVKAFPFDIQFETIETGYYVPTRVSYHDFGMRDMRVFTWDDGVYLAMLDQRLKGGGLAYVMTVQRVFPSATPAVELRFTASTAERQWIPIDQIANPNTGNVDYLFARNTEPHQIVQCSHDGLCVEAASTSHSMFFFNKFKTHYDGLRLFEGSNAVRVSDKFYGAILNKKSAASKKVAHFAYLFEAKHPWSIVKVSKQALNILPAPKCHPQDSALCITHVTGLTFVDGKLVISYSESEFNSKFYISTVEAVFSDMEDVVDPVAKPSSLKVNRFPDEDPNGPVDEWLENIKIPPIEITTPRVALVCIWYGKRLPDWIDYFVLSTSYAADKGRSRCAFMMWR